jgi:hypothetical protein
MQAVFVIFLLIFVNSEVKLVAVKSLAGYLRRFPPGRLAWRYGPVVRRLPLVLAALVAFCLCAPAQAALVVTSVTRSVSVTAGSMSDGVEEDTVGQFFGVFPISDESPAGTVEAFASQGSDAPADNALSMSGTGTTSSVANLTGDSAFNSSAESIIEATFTVDAPGLYSLVAAVEWHGISPPFVGEAVFELHDDASTELASLMASSALPESDSVTTFVSLSPGTTYTLLARSNVEGSGNPGEGVYNASATWNFDLAVVPEAGPVLIMTPLAIVAAWSAWRSRRKAAA